jgi:hypothetical protein
VFQRPPCAPAEPRRPATARSARPHAHIGRRCPPDRSTAPLWCFPRRRRDPPPPLVPLDRSSDSGLRDCAFAFLTAILAVPSRDFPEVVRACVTGRPRRVPCSWASRGELESGATRHASVLVLTSVACFF